MKFLTFFEGIFFSLLYSLGPFYAVELVRPLPVGPPLQNPTGRSDLRILFLSALSFCYFLVWTFSGFRTRYVIWHLERRRRSSGFSPLETAGVAAYHLVLLCAPTELAISILDGKNPSPFTVIWFSQLKARMGNVLLFSIVEHTLLENMGIFDRLRIDYFEQDRD